jgi:endonuclease/exonuclease/phosphatase family metal-dependent hydrolase
MDGILQGSYAVRSGAGLKKIKILNWNIERGLKLPAILDFTRSQGPDICLFQEVDLNARRTGRRNIADVLAASLEFNYAFGIEFEELSQGSKTERAFQGQAVLARSSILEPRILRFSRQSHIWDPRWYKPRLAVFQPRRGGRMALAAEIGFGPARLVVYNLHLESQGDDGLRLAQLSEVVHDSARYPPNVPVVVAGDMNSYHQPWLSRTYLLHCGFQDACDGAQCRGTKPNGETLDWIFTRGPVICSDTRVHRETSASDHYPLSTILTLAG